MKSAIAIVIVLFAAVNIGFGQITSDKELADAIRKVPTLKDDTLKSFRLFDVAAYYINKKGNAAADLNAARSYCSKGMALSRKLGFKTGEYAGYTLLSQIWREDGKQEKGLPFIQKAAAYFRTHQGSRLAARAFTEKAVYYTIDRDTNITNKIFYNELAVANFEVAAPASRELADAYRGLADLYSFQDENMKAAITVKKAIPIYHKLGYYQIQDVYDILGKSLADAGDLKQGLKYGILALQTAEKFKDSSMTVCTIYYSLGYIYNKLRDDDKSAFYLLKAIKMAEADGDTITAMRLSSNLAIVYSNINQPEKAIKIASAALKKCPPNLKVAQYVLMANLVKNYAMVKQYGASEEYYHKALQIGQGQNLRLTNESNLRIGAVFLFMGQKKYNEVAQQLDSLEAIYNINKHTILAQRIALYRFQLDSVRGNLTGAVQHYQRYKAISDSIAQQRHDKQIAEMQIQYDLTRKDADITLKAKNIELLTRQNQLQKKSLQSETYMRNAILFAAVLLLLLLGISYSRFRVKKQSNYRLELQQAEINGQNNALKQLLDEREWLLKEVHHRVKNNLQIVISLLHSQIRYVNDDFARDVIRESQNRMNSISLIHQKLYQSENLSGISIANYIHELASFLEDSFNTRGRVAFLIKVEEELIDVTQAVPLGLILNEAVTNCLKYAFTGRKDGKVSISLVHLQNNELKLIIADNGQGLPEGFDVYASQSLGMSLMHGLSQQLGGKIAMVNDGGLRIELVFSKREMLNGNTIKFSA